MGKKDIEEKDYFNDNLHFADACNGILFQGVQNILPEELEEADTELIYPDKKLAMVVRLDGMRYWRKQGVNIALLSLEHQSLTDYHMVFRNMMAESMAYYKQWKKNKQRYSGEYRKWYGKLFRFRNSKEFLSGMAKEDKFIPVILIVVNWSLEKWDGAVTLHEMMNLPDELKKYVNNYKLNIFDYHDYSDFSVFTTEVRVVFEALKTAGEKESMKKLFKRLQEIEIETARLLESLLSIKFDKKYIVKGNDGKERVEVCKAWDDNRKEGIAIGLEEGIEEGRKQGIEQGVKQGIEQGVKQGIEQTLFRMVYKKVKKNYTLDMIADDLEEEIEVIRPIYEKVRKEIQ